MTLIKVMQNEVKIKLSERGTTVSSRKEIELNITS